MPQNNPDMEVVGTLDSSMVDASNSSVLLDTSSFHSNMEELGSHLDNFTNLNYHTDESMLIPDQIIEDHSNQVLQEGGNVGRVVEVGGESSNSMDDNNTLSEVSEMLQHMDSVNSLMSHPLQSAPFSSMELNTSCSNAYLQDSMGEVDNTMENVSSYGQNSVSLDNSSFSPLNNDSFTSEVIEPPLSKPSNMIRVLPPSSGARNNQQFVIAQANNAKYIIQPQISPSNVQHQTNVMGRNIKVQSINTSNSDQSSPHQQIRFITTSGAKTMTINKNLLLNSAGSKSHSSPGGGVVTSLGNRSVLVSGYSAEGDAQQSGGNPIVSNVPQKLTLQQAQKLGLLSPTKGHGASKIILQQVKQGNAVNQQLSGNSGSRIVLTPVNNANNTASNVMPLPPGSIFLKSPNAKMLSNQQQILGNNTIKIQPNTGSVNPAKFIVRNTNQKSGIVRTNLFANQTDSIITSQQSVIKLSASSPAVQAAAAQANSTVINKGGGVFRLVSPAGGGGKILSAANRSKPISIAPNNQGTKQQCIFVPVSGSNLVSTSNGTATSSQSNSVYMIPLQYLSQLQSGNGTSASGAQLVSLAPSNKSSMQIVESKLAVPSPSPSSLNNKLSTPKSLLDTNGIKARKPCNCNKSQCLKLYCDCFANGEFCNNCNCTNCFNNLSHEEERQKAIKSCLERNPGAFKPKIGKGGKTTERRHNKGCNCKRSSCLKNYCECYEAKIPCSAICKCCGCKNVDSATLLERHKLQHLPPDPATIMQQSSVTSLHHSDSIGSSLPSVSSFSSLHSCSSLSSSLGINADRNNKTVATPSKFGMNNKSALVPSSSSVGTPPVTSFSYKISQDVVSATTGCILATAARCQRQALDSHQTEAAIVKEFSSLLGNIIRGCMQQQSNYRNRGFNAAS